MDIQSQNIALCQEMIAAWQSGDLSSVDAFVCRSYVGHVSTGDRNLEGLKLRITEFGATFPDVVFKIEDQIATSDKVVTRMTACATDAACGREVVLMGINISRFSGGQLAEEWATWEQVRS